jgi:hypothetical protein
MLITIFFFYLNIKDCSGIEEPNRFILCYTDSSINLENDDLACRCSHLVVPSVVNITQNSTDFALNEGNSISSPGK